MKKWLLIGLGVVVALGLLGGAALWYVAFAPAGFSFEEERSVFIPRDASLEQAVDSLVAREVIPGRQRFELLAKATGWGSQIKAGHYRFGAGASTYDVLQTLRRGLQTPVRLTIPPGTRPEVAAAVAARDMEFDQGAFLAALQDTSLAHELGTDVDHLFGYLMPETYQFYWLTSPEDVIRNVKQQFDERFAEELERAEDSLGLSPDDVVSLASIVEWETAVTDEKPAVAGVYTNRLRIGMKLDADPTVQYAILEDEGEKRRLLFEDYEIEHPYNTYLFRGLPPGPVTNPSPSSVHAVTQPEDHDYLYFVATGTGDGRHMFSRSLREHNNKRQIYLRNVREWRRQQREDG